MDLESYLVKNKKTPAAFAREVGISYVSIYNYLHGRRPNFIVAKKMVDFTRGQISFSDFGWTEKQISCEINKIQKKNNVDKKKQPE